jgi:hypothetical protein
MFVNVQHLRDFPPTLCVSGIVPEDLDAMLNAERLGSA